MNTTEHLTENQLNAYFGDSELDGDAKQAVGRHLLVCDFCLKRMPKPTTDQFWTALMTDNDEDFLETETKFSAKKWVYIGEFLNRRGILALSAGAVAIVLVFSAFIWMNGAKSVGVEAEITENFESAPFVVKENSNGKINFPATDPNEVITNRSAVTPNTETSNKKPEANNNPVKPGSKAVSKTEVVSNIPKDKNVIISATRGGNSPKCGEQSALELTVGKKDETIVLKWKSVPKAVKYHLYISDDEEILIDEFVTENETSFVLSKPLDPLKTYKWKIIVTLENGQTVVGNSQNFTVKNFQNKQSKPNKKEKSETRCPANG